MPSVSLQGKIKMFSHRAKSSQWVKEINRIVTHCGKSNEENILKQDGFFNAGAE